MSFGLDRTMDGSSYVQATGAPFAAGGSIPVLQVLVHIYKHLSHHKNNSPRDSKYPIFKDSGPKNH